MNADELVRVLRAYVEGLFPKTCSTCGRVYPSLREYLLGTTPTGAAISYDADAGDWTPSLPVGAFAFANCPCGTTLALTTDALPLATRHAALAWIRSETEGRGAGAGVVVGALWDAIRASVLSDGAKRGGP